MAASDHVGEQFETFYHLTDRKNFKPDPKQVPTDNAISIVERSRPGLFVGATPHSVESWWNGHGYHRPYVAEVSVPKGVAEEGRWGGERFIPGEQLHQARVNRVIPADAHARETYGGAGWVEEHHGTTFDTGAPIDRASSYRAFPDYRYSGPDVREFTPQQHGEHMKRIRSYRKAQGG